MLSFGEVKGASNVSYTTQNGKVTTAAYVATAKFKNAEGRITARLINPLRVNGSSCGFMLTRLCFFNDRANPLLLGRCAIKRRRVL